MMHKHALISNSVSDAMRQVMDEVIRCIDYIKARAQNSRLFAQLCKDNNAEFENLLLHTDVRWLIKGKCLKRVF